MTSAALVIANTSEAFLPLIGKYDSTRQQSRVRDEHVLSDRAILWDGDVKLVITSLPVPHVDYAKTALGNGILENLSPKSPSESLCRDILSDQCLLSAIVQRLSRYSVVKLLSYVSSPQLVNLIHAPSAIRNSAVTR